MSFTITMRAMMPERCVFELLPIVILLMFMIYFEIVHSQLIFQYSLQPNKFEISFVVLTESRSQPFQVVWSHTDWQSEMSGMPRWYRSLDYTTITVIETYIPAMPSYVVM